MRACIVGRPGWDDLAATVVLQSSQTLLDYDLVLMDLSGISGANDTNSSIRRREEVVELLSLGRTVIAFTCHCNLDFMLPIGGVTTVASSGDRIDFRGPPQLKTFWSSTQKTMRYQAYLKGNAGQSFLFVSETNKPVASWIKRGQGNLFLLPWLLWDGNHNSHYYAILSQFIEHAQKLVLQLAPKKSDFTMPGWSVNYGWHSERKLRTGLLALQQQAESISREVTIKSDELNTEDKLKILFTAKGDILTDTVTDVFRQLGVKAEPGEPGRDDIIIEFEGKHGVVEVKGRNGSAAEKDLAQLQKWVSISLADREIDAKGILVVNAFCDTPLVERVEPNFPDQMLKLAKRYEHCLLTTTQLLGLLFEARANPEKRVDLINSLFSTVGVYPQFSDWKTFLTSPTPAASKKDA